MAFLSTRVADAQRCPLLLGFMAICGSASAMHVFSLEREQQWDPKHHVEKILGRIADGDVTVACWEPRQTSPYHCHPHATEIYFCFSGGGTMRTPKETIAVVPGSFVVHPPGEV